MVKQAIAIRHVHFEDLGSLEVVLRERDFEINYVDATSDDLRAVDAAAADLLVVLGGPIGAYEEALYPFLVDELTLIERRLETGRPLIGICLGAQLMARALGARVYPSGIKEIGWSSLSLTEAGQSSPWRSLDGVSVLHWHGDTFDLPQGATRLASTPLCLNQAFSHGATALGLQFHIEAGRRQIERWLVGHAVEIAQAGLSVPALRADTALYAPACAESARSCLSLWLDQQTLVDA
jgi:GMP synthase (glutamine-hydrolysing)